MSRIASLFLLIMMQNVLVFAQDFVKLEEQLQEAIAKKKIPGAQVCIVDQDSLLWEGNFGFSDFSDSSLVSSNTMFRIGSTSKSFTGIAIMQLLEKGLLKLEDPISKYIDDVSWKNPWEDTDPVRIIHLLEHTTGFDDMHLKEYTAIADGWTLKQGLDYSPKSRKSRWKPGVHSSYCNSGPPMAAYIIEKITGKTIEEYVEEEIFLPLGMQYATFLKTPYVDSMLAKAYSDAPHVEKPYWHIIQRPAGAINTTATEMGSYLRMFLNKGKPDSLMILSPESIARMERPESTLAAKAGSIEGYAKYLYTRNFNGIKWIGHDGGMEGFLCAMHYSRDLNRGFVIVINSNGDIHGLEELVINALSEGKAGDTLKAVALASDIDPQYLGAYTTATSRNQISRFVERLGSLVRVKIENDTLRYVSGLFDDSQIIYQKDGDLFIESKDGAREPVTFATFEGKKYLQGPGNFKETSPWKVWGELVILILFGISVLALLLIGLVGLFLRLAKKPFPHDKYLLWPGIVSISTIALLIGFQAGSADPFKSLGSPSVWSIMIMISPIILCIASFMSLFTLFQWRRDSAPKWLKVLFLVFAILALIVSIYLLRHGVVGLRTWDY